MFSRKLSLSLAAAAASILAASAAQASFTATITSSGGGGPLLLTGSSAAPALPGTLQIGPINETVDSFSISNFTATSNSPSSTNEAVEVGSSILITNTTSSAETLSINLLDDGFTAPTGSNLQVTAHGTITWTQTDTQNSQDVVTAESVVQGNPVAGTQTSNTLNSGTSLLDLSTYLPTASADLGALGSPYSLGSNLTVQLNGHDAVNVVWYSSVAAVPEPTALTLLGMSGLGALLLVGRRRKA